jgi:hypothetical protein
MAAQQIICNNCEAPIWKGLDGKWHHEGRHATRADARFCEPWRGRMAAGRSGREIRAIPRATDTQGRAVPTRTDRRRDERP